MRTHYVKAIKSAGVVIGYGVYDSIGETETEHARYMVEKHGSEAVALYLANMHRDDINDGTE